LVACTSVVPLHFGRLRLLCTVVSPNPACPAMGVRARCALGAHDLHAKHRRKYADGRACTRCVLAVARRPRAHPVHRAWSEQAHTLRYWHFGFAHATPQSVQLGQQLFEWAVSPTQLRSRHWHGLTGQVKQIAERDLDPWIRERADPVLRTAARQLGASNCGAHLVCLKLLRVRVGRGQQPPHRDSPIGDRTRYSVVMYCNPRSNSTTFTDVKPRDYASLTRITDRHLAAQDASHMQHREVDQGTIAIFRQNVIHNGTRHTHRMGPRRHQYRVVLFAMFSHEPEDLAAEERGEQIPQDALQRFVWQDVEARYGIGSPEYEACLVQYKADGPLMTMAWADQVAVVRAQAWMQTQLEQWICSRKVSEMLAAVGIPARNRPAAALASTRAAREQEAAQVLAQLA
jgi:hypothetical protein